MKGTFEQTGRSPSSCNQNHLDVFFFPQKQKTLIQHMSPVYKNVQKMGGTVAQETKSGSSDASSSALIGQERTRDASGESFLMAEIPKRDSCTPRLGRRFATWTTPKSAGGGFAPHKRANLMRAEPPKPNIIPDSFNEEEIKILIHANALKIVARLVLIEGLFA